MPPPAPPPAPSALPPQTHGSEETAYAATAPPKSIAVAFPRAPVTSTRGVLHLVCALVFASYFVPSLVFAAGVAGGLVSLKAGATLAAVYAVYVASSRAQFEDGWPFDWFLYSWLTDSVLHYYDAVVIREGQAPDENERYVFAYHPHGLYSVLRAASGGVKCWRALFPGIEARWGTFAAAFYIFGVREFSLACGALDAGRATMARCLSKPRGAVHLIPGGIKEMLLTSGGKETKCVLKSRMGFVRLAVNSGAKLVPVLAFNEKHMHELVGPPEFIRKFLHRMLRIAPILPVGRWGTLLGRTHRRDTGAPIRLGVVFGEPLAPSPIVDGDAQGAVERTHAAYCAKLLEMHERYKSLFECDDDTLTFV